MNLHAAFRHGVAVRDAIEHVALPGADRRGHRNREKNSEPCGGEL
jgi:hypothetical protein